jgi:V8-like Glu-specific endopeptidase
MRSPFSILSSAGPPTSGLFLPLGLALALGLGPAACGSKQAPSDLPSFQDLTSAPAAIQNAAEAVVRIRTANESATGSFVSSTGLLLTNNHVLGTEICPVEGCYARLSFDYQRGKPYAPSQTVFVVPVAVNVGLDVAVVQVYADQGGAQLATPHFLTIEPHEANSLIGSHMTLVGHPDGHLKKWTAGEVIQTNGSWIWTTAYSLPGNSGSPILNDAGKLVGIIHRGPVDEGLFTSDGAVTYSIGTASAPIAAAMKAPLPPEMISTVASTTAAAVVAANTVYLNAHVSTYRLAAGGTASILSALGDACDAGLAGTNYAAPEDLTAALAPCSAAESWIECRAEDVSAATVCPAPEDNVTWQSRFGQVNAAWVALNGEVSLTPVSFGIASLSFTRAGGQTGGAASLQQALTAAGKSIDLGVANYLAAFGVSSYAGHDVAAYVTAYASAPTYPLHAGDTASAAGWMIGTGAMTRDQGLAIIEKIYADDAVDINDKLYIEELEYSAGALK